MNFKDEILARYNYSFPPELIAQEPASPRDSARLMVYDRKTQKISLDIFSNVTKYLPKNSLIVFNQTKVLPARLFVKKSTGKNVELLFLSEKNKITKVVANSKLNSGEKLFLNDEEIFEVLGNEKNYFLIQPCGTGSITNVYQVFEKFGKTPIPPYIKNSPLSEEKLRHEYQAIFAKEIGSSAAPTASLHFTHDLLTRIKNAGHEICFITLHVGLGTFSPVTEEHLKEKKLHEEWYEIDNQTAGIINTYKKQNKPVIAVGTTVVRTLESAASDLGQLTNLNGETSLFIQEGYKFKIVDSLITNFHVPKSSLLMLVSALIGREKLLELYRLAIMEKFRLFSFGDGMFII